MGPTTTTEELTIHNQQQEEEKVSSNGTHNYDDDDDEKEQQILAQQFESLVLQNSSNCYNQQTELQKVEKEEEGKLQLYPLRPYAQDCYFFVKTGTCKFGLNCRFNHPFSNKGFQDKESNGTIDVAGKSIDCKYFQTPGGCKHGDACKYKHSAPKLDSKGPELNFLGLPVRPSEQECAYYLRTGSCGYGANCRYHHPEPIAMKEPEPKSSTTNARGGNSHTKPYANGSFQSYGVPQGISHFSNGVKLMNGLPYFPMDSYHQAMPQSTGWNQNQVNLHLPTKKMPLPHQMFNNSKKANPSTHYEQVIQSEEFPLQPGQPDCDYFMKTGDCKYRTTCKFNHPVTRSHKLHLPQLSSKPMHYKSKSHDLSSPNPAHTRKNGTPSHQQQSMNGTYPERPGEPECEFFMKTGNCKFRSACKYHHPKDRMSTSSSCALNEAGFPSRPGARICRNYEQHGTCKYGQNCLFHHPYNVSPNTTDEVARDASEDEVRNSPNDLVHKDLEATTKNVGSDWGDGWVI